MSKPLFSVIVTSKNESEHIEICLKSIKDQDYRNVEIILVDNYSTDETVKLAKKYTTKIFQKGPERSAQRNFGANKSKGKYLLFLDGDMALEKDLIKKAVEKLEKNESLVGLYLPLVWQGQHWLIRLKNFERSFYDQTVLDAVRIVKKSAFNKLGGFDKNLFAGEDWDFNQRLKTLGPIGWVSPKIIHLEDKYISLFNYLKKVIYYSPNMDKYLKKWGRSYPEVKKQFSLYYRLVGVFFEQGKWKQVFQNPHLYLGVIVLKILSGLVFLTWPRK
jgi:glycosyltransferase involved in cell wall biosynthesis